MIKQRQYSNKTNTIIMKVDPINRLKVIASEFISYNEIKEHIQDLIDTKSINLDAERINLSQVSQCSFDLLFNKRERKSDGVVETYYMAV